MFKNKNPFIKFVQIVLIIVALIITISFLPSIFIKFIEYTNPQYEIKRQNNEKLINLIDNLAKEDVSQDEIDDLYYLYNEETLAYETYDYLYNKWGIEIFNEVKQNEKVHQSVIEALFTKYGLEKFANKIDSDDKRISYLISDIEQLKRNSSKSITSALKAQAMLEEKDIKDLTEKISRTNNEDIKSVYEYLLLTSENHLRSGVFYLKEIGIIYKPTVINYDYYEKIISKPIQDVTLLSD